MDIKTLKKPHHAMIARLTFSGRELDLMNLAYYAVKKEHDRIHFSGGEIDWKKFKTEYTFDSSELMSILDLSRQGLYDALDKATSGIMSKVAVIKFPDKKGFDKVSLFRRARFRDGRLTLVIEDELVHYFVDYSQGFTAYDMTLSLSLVSDKAYAKRVLELISRFKNSREYSLTIGELCEIVGVEFRDYKRPQYFFESVLDSPIKMIVKKSNGVWQQKKGYPKGYKVKKGGRAYSLTDVITFKMQYNDPEAEAKAAAKAEKESQTTEGILHSMALTADFDNPKIQIAMMAHITLQMIKNKTATKDQMRGFFDSLRQLEIEADKATHEAVNQCVDYIDNQ